MLFSRCKKCLLVLPFTAGLAACSPAQLQAGANLNCALAADGATVVAIAKPGYAQVAAAGSTVGCTAGQQIGAALGQVK